MPLRKRSVGSVAETIYDEFCFPDEGYFGTGRYSIFLKKDALSLEKGFGYGYGNRDYDIELKVRYNPKEYTRVIECCMVKMSEALPAPISGFLLPKELDRSVEHLVTFDFTDWRITGASLDEVKLEELSEGSEVE